MNEANIQKIVESVIRELAQGNQTSEAKAAPTASPVSAAQPAKAVVNKDEAVPAPMPAPSANGERLDIVSPEAKRIPLLDNPMDMDGLRRMMTKTSARIGVGRCGPRVKTQTMLALRADHAAARDAVFLDVDEDLLKRLDLKQFQTKCKEKNEYLTRPDRGREFTAETEQEIKSYITNSPDVMIYVSDGLSSKSVEANVENLLPSLMDGVKAQGFSVGKPFFVKFGRVAAMDHISELTGAKVTCVLIGERPGLGSAESMSAYIAYKATVGMPEANRTVVSNIYSGGISAVEAGAYISEVIGMIMKNQASGVNLKK